MRWVVLVGAMLVGCIGAALCCATTWVRLMLVAVSVLPQAKQPGAQGQRREVSSAVMRSRVAAGATR